MPYEAAQGRRVNAIGAYFSHGPQAGRLELETCACLPKGNKRKGAKGRARRPRPPPEQAAAAHGLTASEVGISDAQRLLAFVWRVAGRPVGAPAGWRRERPLVIVLDNYSVHQSRAVRGERAALEAAGVTLFALPSYSPELSAIEPIWHDVKHHQLTRRSYALLGELKRAVDAALRGKAGLLRDARARTEHLLEQAT